jgi:hypothetical protein
MKKSCFQSWSQSGIVFDVLSLIKASSGDEDMLATKTMTQLNVEQFFLIKWPFAEETLSFKRPFDQMNLRKMTIFWTRFRSNFRSIDKFSVKRSLIIFSEMIIQSNGNRLKDNSVKRLFGLLVFGQIVFGELKRIFQNQNFHKLYLFMEF